MTSILGVFFRDPKTRGWISDLHLGDLKTLTEEADLLIFRSLKKSTFWGVNGIDGRLAMESNYQPLDVRMAGWERLTHGGCWPMGDVFVEGILGDAGYVRVNFQIGDCSVESWETNG